MEFNFDELLKEIEDKNQSIISQCSEKINIDNYPIDKLPLLEALSGINKLVEQLKVDALTILKIEQYRQDKSYTVFNTPFSIQQINDDLIELGLKKLTICSCAIWANKSMIIKLAPNEMTAYAMSEPLDEFAINMQERGYVMKCSANKTTNSHNHKTNENCN